MHLGIAITTNPLTGKRLESWQLAVGGPGGRVTIVDTRPGAVLQPWITRTGPGQYADDGRPLATDRPQSLPELVTTGARGGWLWIVLLAGLGWLASRRARGAREW